MTSDPLELALRELTHVERLLTALVESSESFGYVRAKAVLGELRLKVKLLGRARVELSAASSRANSEHIVPFPGMHRRA